MALITTGCAELDEALDGGLPEGQITSVYSSIREFPVRRRLLCSISDANDSVFVDSSTETVRPRNGALWHPDIRSPVRTILSGAGGASVVIVDPVEFDLEEEGDGLHSRRAQVIQRLMKNYASLCREAGKTLVLGWTRVNRLPTGANFLSSCILHVKDEFTISVEKRRDAPPKGEVRVNRLWHPSSNFDTEKSRFDIDIDID